MRPKNMVTSWEGLKIKAGKPGDIPVKSNANEAPRRVQRGRSGDLSTSSQPANRQVCFLETYCTPIFLNYCTPIFLNYCTPIFLNYSQSLFQGGKMVLEKYIPDVEVNSTCTCIDPVCTCNDPVSTCIDPVCTMCM